MTDQTRRAAATATVQERIALATIERSKDPIKVAVARLHLEALRGERTWESYRADAARIEQGR